MITRTEISLFPKSRPGAPADEYDEISLYSVSDVSDSAAALVPAVGETVYLIDRSPTAPRRPDDRRAFTVLSRGWTVSDFKPGVILSVALYVEEVNPEVSQ